MKRIAIGIAGFTVMCAISLFVGVFHYSSNINQPLQLPANTLFRVESGDTANTVLINLLSMSNAPIPDYVGKVWLKLSFKDKTVKQGLYQLDETLNIAAVFALLHSGKQKQFRLHLIEGLTWTQWLQYLTSHPHIDNDWNSIVELDLLRQAKRQFNRDVMSLEGLLLADTYFFNDGDKLSHIVQRAMHAMVELLQQQSRTTTLPHVLRDTYESLILASIVEKETAVAAERPEIAGVFVNRLQQNMRLQTDPTIIYGLGDEYQGDITREHIRRPTPYNTYVIKGLPPTPIAMIGSEALRAVYNYSATANLFFVAKGDGTHFFSASLAEHNAAVSKYQLSRKDK